MAMANLLAFVVTCLVRIVFGPYAIFIHTYYFYTVGRTNETAIACLPTAFDHIIAVTGTFFNVLNLFWFYKILKKLQRKLKGVEGVKDSNQLGKGEPETATAATTNGDVNRKVKFKKEQD